MSRLPQWFALVLVICLAAACANPTTVPVEPAPALTATPTRVRLARVSAEPSTAPDQSTPAPTPLPHIEAPLVWLLRAAPPPDAALVNEELNRRLASMNFNARVELRFVSEADYAVSLAEMAASDALPDLLTTGGLEYERGVAAGWFQAIDPGDAPALWASLPAPVWQAVRRDGKVYSVPAQGVWTRPYGVAVRADVLLALGMSPDLAGIQRFDDLNDLLNQIQGAIDADQLDPALWYALGPVDLLRPQAAGYEPLAANFVVQVDDPQEQVVNWLQTPAALDLASLRRAWQQAGYEPPLIPDPAGWLDLCQDGRFAVAVGALGQPRRCQVDWVEKPLAPVYYSTDAILTTMTALGSADPERASRALYLLERIRSDPALYNLLARGVEGRHWQWDAAHEWVQLLPGGRYTPDIAAQLGAPGLLYFTSAQEYSLWQHGLAWNEQALVSPALGFRFDPRPAAGPLAAIRGLERELSGPLAAGDARDVEAALARLNEQFEAVGAKAVIAELLRQFDLWRANR